jgi:hypothetical protein
VAVPARVAEEHPDLAVLDAARGAAVLPLHARRLLALLHEPGLVQHQHGAGIAEVLDHVGPQVVADRVGVPPHPAEEVLHPVRRAVARRLGQLPAVLAPRGRQQPAQVRQQAPARLDPREPRREPLRQLVQALRPPLGFAHVRHARSSSRAERPNRGCSTSFRCEMNG